MSRPSKPSQSNLFTSGDSIFSGKSLMIYEDSNSWHTLFREKVTNKIDETIFKPLFSKGKGTPNCLYQSITIYDDTKRSRRIKR